MSTYRESRNLEASLIDFLKIELNEDGWTGINVEKSLKQSQIKIPVILIYVQDVDPQQKEIGSGDYLRFPTVIIRIFADNDGQRLDLADWILEKLEDNIEYYEYVVTNGAVSSKNLAGNIVIRKIIRNEKELSNTNPEVLEKEDRYRHRIEVSIFVGLI